MIVQMNLEDDSRAELEAEAAILYQARMIIKSRFRTGKHDTTADLVRRAAAELVSRARHPSRSPLAATDNGLDQPGSLIKFPGSGQ